MQELMRSTDNPIIKPSEIKPSRDYFGVVGVFNPAAIQVNGETVLFLRVAEEVLGSKDKIRIPIYNAQKKDVEIVVFDKDDPSVDNRDPRVVFKDGSFYLTSLSHLRLARSRDGIDFHIDNKPTLFPCETYEAYGIEDARVHYIGGVYYLTYSAVSQNDIATALMRSQDLRSFERCGIIFDDYNRDVVLFTDTFDKKYYALHRPFGKHIERPSIRIASSTNLRRWNDEGCILEPRQGMWDSKKLGAGPPPFKINEGWLLLYHGVNEEEAYATGAVLLGRDDPTHVLARTKVPLFCPQELYEKEGFFPNTVFTNGAIMRENDTISIYYGACDETVCLASITTRDILNKMN